MSILLISLLIVIGDTVGGLNSNGTNISTSNFKTILKTPYFVDKTEFIETFFHLNATSASAILAPRFFGKTTNMDMLKQFVEIKIDVNGKIIKKNETENYKIFTDMYHKVDGWDHLHVYKNKRIFEEHFGEYLVIHLDFKQLSGKDWKEFICSFKEMVRTVFEPHRYFLETSFLIGIEEKWLKGYTSPNVSLNTYSPKFHYLMKQSFHFLSRILNQYFNKSVIVLIDEYDAPIRDAIFNSGIDSGKIIEFTQELISNLMESNPYVKRGLISSCVWILPKTVNHLNNITIFQFGQNHPYEKFYGLTTNEVAKLTAKFHISERFSEIERWYGGYVTRGDSNTLYNTHSIVSYLQQRLFKNYWGETGYIETLSKIFLSECLINRMELMLKDHPLVLKKHEGISARSLRVLIKVFDEKKVKSKESDTLLSFLTELGYFTTIDSSNNEVVVKVPNEEIRTELGRLLHSADYFVQKLNITYVEVNSYVKSLLNLQPDVKSYKKLAFFVLRLFITNGMPENENEFKKPLFIFAKVLGKDKFLVVESEVSVNTPQGGTPINKLIDLLVVRNDSTGIILDFNYVGDSCHKNLTSSVPLKRIIDNDYRTIFDRFKNVTDRMYVGLSLKKANGSLICSVCALHNSLKMDDSITVDVKLG